MLKCVERLLRFQKICLLLVLAILLSGHVTGYAFRNLTQDKKLLKAFGVEAFDVELLDGGMTLNNVFLIKCKSGKQYVLKTFHPGVSIKRRKREIAAQAFAAERGISARVEYIDPEWRFFVMEYIDGRMLSRLDLRRTDTLKKIANLLKRLHTEKAPFKRFKPQPMQLTTYYLSAIKKGVVFPSKYSEIYREYMSATERWLQKDLLIWCHGDLNATNILLASNGRVYIIDWETASFDNPYSDLGFFALVNGLNSKQQITFLQYYLEKDDISNELKMLNEAMRRTSFFTATVWFKFSESDADKHVAPHNRQKRLDSLLNSKGLKTGLQYIADEEVVRPMSGDTKAIRLYALGFLKTYMNWQDQR